MKNENENSPESLTKEDKKAKKKADKAARKERWKAQKAEAKAARKERRQKRKNRYKDAPFLVKLWHKVLVKLLILAIVFYGFFQFLQSDAGIPLLVKIIMPIYNSQKDKPVSQEDIYSLSPKDETGDARIQKLASVDADDTWTICFYMVGSNLEDMGENDLSDVTQSLVNSIYQQNKAEAASANATLLPNYAAELKEKGLDLPEYMYEPVHPTESTTSSSSTSTVATTPGYASNDIQEICSGDWPDNINIVIQTGGATRWSNSLVNPNKTQRFEYKDGRLKEIENLPLQDSCDPDTLSDFMSYCDENYPADHRMLVLWDHGGGVVGYGVDDIFGTNMSLEMLQEAFAQTYEADPENPHYDIIGFDACLMASTEVAHNLYGYGKYLAASEETEPGDGWTHNTYLEAMSADATLSPAAVAEAITDAYMDHYMAQNYNTSFLGLTFDANFSTIDINAAEKTYQSYCSLNAKLLQDSINDIQVLSKIGNAANNSTRFAGSSYMVYNTIDLGNYMEALSEYYPAECQEVLANLDEAVLYHRQSGYLSDSTGLSIYMPVDIKGTGGLSLFLKYVNSISDDMATKALYYYKVSGCLNDEFQSYADSMNYGTAKTMNTKALQKLGNNEISLTDDGFSLTLNEEQMENAQSAKLEVGYYDKEQNQITYYGQSSSAAISEDGQVSTTFQGKWIMLDGCPLATEIVGESDSSISYRSPVYLNGSKHYLTFTYDKESQEINLTGAIEVDEDSSDPSAEQAYVIDKTTTNLTAGDVIYPIYDVYDCTDGSTTSTKADSRIVFKLSTKITMGNLPSGSYLDAIILSDIRGDEYYSAIVEQTINSGKITNQMINEDFVGSSY